MKLYKSVFILILLVIILPENTKVFKFANDLSGVVLPINTDVNYTFENYLSGDIQEKAKLNLKNKIGARNLLIRSYNQINYSFFKMLSSGIIVLNDGSFIKENYIESFYGADYVGILN